MSEDIVDLIEKKISYQILIDEIELEIQKKQKERIFDWIAEVDAIVKIHREITDIVFDVDIYGNNVPYSMKQNWIDLFEKDNMTKKFIYFVNMNERPRITTNNLKILIGLFQIFKFKSVKFEQKTKEIIDDFLNLKNIVENSSFKLRKFPQYFTADDMV
jgi:hypothetical protein